MKTPVFVGTSTTRQELNSIIKMSRSGPQTTVQRQIQEDWANREYIEVITTNIKKIADFLNSFGELSSQYQGLFQQTELSINHNNMLNQKIKSSSVYTTIHQRIFTEYLVRCAVSLSTLVLLLLLKFN